MPVPQALPCIRERRFTLVLGTTITMADIGRGRRQVCRAISFEIDGGAVRPIDEPRNGVRPAAQTKATRGRQAQRRSGTGMGKVAAGRGLRGPPERGGRRTRQDQISARHSRR